MKDVVIELQKFEKKLEEEAIGGGEEAVTEGGEATTDPGADGEKTEQNLEDLTEWMTARLDLFTYLPVGQAAPTELDLTRCVNYDLSKGLCVSAFMMPGIKGNNIKKM